MARLTNFSPMGSYFFGVLKANHSKTANVLLNGDIAQKQLDLVIINEPYFTNFGMPFFPNKDIRIISIKDRPRTAI